MAKTSLNLIGAAGEYYVCAELCKQGYLGLLTPKNNPLYDVVAVNHSGSRSVAIQVKTRSIGNKQGWKLGKTIEHSQNDSLFIALVDLKETSCPDIYIYQYNTLSKKVSECYKTYINTPKKDGTNRKEVEFRWCNEVDIANKNNWEPIIKALKDEIEEGE